MVDHVPARRAFLDHGFAAAVSGFVMAEACRHWAVDEFHGFTSPPLKNITASTTSPTTPHTSTIEATTNPQSRSLTQPSTHRRLTQRHQRLAYTPAIRYEFCALS